MLHPSRLFRPLRLARDLFKVFIPSSVKRSLSRCCTVLVLCKFMNPLCRAFWLSIAFSIAHAKSIPRSAPGSQTFSLETTRQRPLWRNSTSRLHRRNPDAVSIHADANHNYAWTPIQLGGRSTHYFVNVSSNQLTEYTVQNLGVMLDIGSTQLYIPLI